MTSILSSVSAQFGKALILGTVLPVSIFVSAGVLIGQALVGGSLQDLLTNIEKGWAVLILPFIAIVLSGLLFNLNVPLTRLYEGYPWKASWLGRWLTAMHQRKFDALGARWRGLRTLLYFTARQVSAEVLSPSVEVHWGDIGRSLRSDYPVTRSSILPTRLGNVIRSFENYPRTQYGISAIPLWPRLLSKIDERYAEGLDNAKISFDFALNCSFLSVALAVAFLALGLFHPVVPSSQSARALLFSTIVVCLFLSYMFYLMMLGRAVTWGEMVKGAFDLYRRPLLAQLGYEVVPKTLSEERSLWGDISQQILFGDSPRVRPAEFIGSAVAVRGEPSHALLQVTRGVSTTQRDETPTITLTVKNATVPPRRVERVVLTDAVPESFYYVWNSASVPVAGTNPYKFEIGALEPEEMRVVTYRITQLEAKPSGD